MALLSESPSATDTGHRGNATATRRLARRLSDCPACLHPLKGP